VDEKITVEVTQEMINAVRAHDRARIRQYEDENMRRQREHQARMDAEIREKVRAVFPDVNEDQHQQLEAAFDSFFSELYDR
jgi:hypothetical protein